MKIGFKEENIKEDKITVINISLTPSEAVYLKIKYVKNTQNFLK